MASSKVRKQVVLVGERCMAEAYGLLQSLNVGLELDGEGTETGRYRVAGG